MSFNKLKKCLAIGIILLFVGITFSPVINANNIDELSKIKQKEFTIQTVNTPFPLSHPNELFV